MAKVGNPCFSIRPPADRPDRTILSEMKRIKLWCGALFRARGISRVTGEREGGIWRERGTCFSQNMRDASDIQKRGENVWLPCRHVSSFEFGACRASLLGKYRSAGRSGLDSLAGVNKTDTVPRASGSGVRAFAFGLLVIVAHVLSAEVRLRQKGFYSRPLRHHEVRLRRQRRCLNRQQLELRGGEFR